MSVAEWDDTYGIHHWRILWSSYGKLPWVGFEPATTEPSSNALTDWGMRPCVQLSLKVNFLMPLEFHHLLSVTFPFNFYSHSTFIICSVSHFISAVWLRQSSRLVNRKFLYVITWTMSNQLIYMVFTTDGFSEVPIEGWPEWDLKPQPLIPFRRSNRLSFLVVVSTLTLSYFYTATPILLFLQCKIALRPFSFVSRHVYLIKVFYT